MNGMKAKKLRQEHAKRFTQDGLPRNSKDWTAEDWRDLWTAIQAAIAKIAERHKENPDA